MHLLLSLLLLMALSTSGQEWVSPCPNLFEYDAAYNDTWHGEIKLNPTEEVPGVWMRIVLDSPPINVFSDFGDVVKRAPNEYLLRKPNIKLSLGETHRINVTVKYDTSKPAPQLIGFRLNARVICPENGII